jgi:hypothetical protein
MQAEVDFDGTWLAAQVEPRHGTRLVGARGNSRALRCWFSFLVTRGQLYQQYEDVFVATAGEGEEALRKVRAQGLGFGPRAAVPGSGTTAWLVGGLAW